MSRVPRAKRNRLAIAVVKTDRKAVCTNVASAWPLNGEQEADDDDDASGRAASRNSLRKRFHWTTYLLT